ncbi:MAG: hypothetical protein JST21_07780 [Bacteroidetes bacterium]|nr:hypothetical protein [Bacteroidota bacterium]
MKKLIIIAIAALLVTAAIVSPGMKKTQVSEVNKHINLEVYKMASYGSPAYENTTATLEVTIVRIRGNQRDTAFQYKFQPKQLKDFPDSNQPMVQKIIIPNVNDKKEKLEVYYKLSYDANGSVLNFLNTSVIGKGEQSGKLNIQI